GILFEATGDIAPPPVAPGEFVTANQIFTLVGIRFPAPGNHKFVVNVGEVTHETPLTLVKAGRDS
ncbi:MAG TPA: hypothetical protein VFI96_09020, partial [Longimicrobiaceae bacterium]|nr:hypothetical protein [Longimicrobiaceae bacterium]